MALLVTVVLMAGLLMDGVSAAESSFVRRRLSGSGVPRAGAASGFCVVPCFGITSCCVIPKNPFGFGFCTTLSIDPLNCGTCGVICPGGTICCNGKCANLLTDKSNCGLCGRVCQAKDKCFLGFCKYGA